MTVPFICLLWKDRTFPQREFGLSNQMEPSATEAIPLLLLANKTEVDNTDKASSKTVLSPLSGPGSTTLGDKQ